MDIDSSDEVIDLAKGFNAFVANLGNIITHVRNTAYEVNEKVQGIDKSMLQIDSLSAEQENKTDQVAVAMKAKQAQAENASERILIANKKLNDLVTLIQDTAGMSTEIATATEEQASMSQDVAKNIQAIADFSAQAPTAVKSRHSECERISSLAENLYNQLEQFKT